ncbi:MAG TPA: hypothetical protein VNW47_16555 [Terriglobales bacterium]|jgi:hypothetical protein|nr:hypothetical protein [Terriglobales bacterium]
MTPDSLRQMIADFLAGARAALVVEDGAVAFDLAESKYFISGEYNKCLLHLWSSERNVVRRVLDAEIKGTSLRLQVQRMGQNRPTRLDFFRDRDRRSPAARQTARVAYAARIQRALARHFPGWTVSRLSTNMDLHRSFGPAYLRGLLQQGQRALAVVGVNEQETQSTIDRGLTCGLLWLDACRLAQRDRRVVEGLAIILPKGTAALTRQRMAHLHPTAAKWQLHEFDEGEDALSFTDIACGNLSTRLVRATDEAATCERFAESIVRVRAVLPQCDFAVLSPAVVSFRLRGLEFAQARIAHDPRNFQSGQEIVFGVGPEERVLDDSNEAQFIDLMRLAASIRHKDGPKPHPLWRMHPERWLESLVFKKLEALDGRLRIDCAYSQVPAFSGVDRAMIDVLAITRENRLAVVELKADEDIHLPLQGVDYWARVAWHQERGEFRKFGYFPGIDLSSRKPLLLLVAPAFHVHPATDAVLRYLSPEIEWELFGIDEHWREGVRAVFRKRASDRRNEEDEAANRRSA